MESSPENSKGLDHVFVYGCLLVDEIVEVLLKRVPHSSPAILNGFHSYNINGRLYPAILPVENKSVSGKILSGITPLELETLDSLEDVQYERCTVEVLLSDKSTRMAYAYVWADKNDPNLYGEWNYEEWRQLHMDGFIKIAKEFAKELEKMEPKQGLEIYESFYKQSTSDDPSPSGREPIG